ncbi:MAG: hypothetical protein LDL41_01390 [Coleofasciculus sp. S288]|nr:hypothetical protein [Coleofasciculus sp. S288]
MKRIFSLLTPTATAAAILMSGIPPAQAQELVLTPMFNSVVAQHSPEIPSRQLELSPPLPGNGRPDERTDAGTRAAQPPVALPEKAFSKVLNFEF